MRKRLPARHLSRVPERTKAALAAQVLLEACAGHLDDSAIAARLRAGINPHWSFLSCLQYLSGKKAIAALSSLPEEWLCDGYRKEELLKAVAIAAHAVVHAHPDGEPLCASHLAQNVRALPPFDAPESE